MNMSKDDKKWKQFEKDYRNVLFETSKDPLKPRVFQEDKIVLTDNFEEACEELKNIAVDRYKDVLELASEMFAELDVLAELMKKASDWDVNRAFNFYNNDSWMDRQNKIAELDKPTVTRRDVYEIEESSERYFPEIFNSKNQHLAEILKTVDGVAMDIAHLMAHLTAIINNPDQYLVIDEDKNKGEAPF